MKLKKILATSLLLSMIPRVAMAQNILGILLVLAAIPLLNIFFAILYAMFSQSGKAFFRHSGLVILWMVLFWFFSSYTTSDILAWTPIFLSISHSIYLAYASLRCLFNTKEETNSGHEKEHPK